MLRSGLTILSGNAAAAFLLLLRNLVVAALIPVGDYGLAATFAMVMTLVEMATDLGLHSQIVQSYKGEDARFQAALQGFQVLRGVLAGLVLFALAGPLAGFMGVPEVTWAYQVLALVPVLNACQHFDMHRLGRDMVFGPLMLTRSLPALVSLVLVWPLAARLGDYRVMLWAIMAQAALMLVLSHLTARRPYRLVLDGTAMRESLAFGWPLLLNGALLFAVFQGDKIIVGRVLGMEALALIAMGVTLTLTPTLVLSRSVQNFFLPQLSRRDAEFTRLAQVVQEAALVVSLWLLALVGLLGPVLIALALGPKYASLEPLLIWLALLQALRMARVGIAVVALAVGATTLTMWGNLIRVALLPLVWWAAVQGAELRTLIWIGIVGELAGYVLGVLLLTRRTGLPVIWGPQGATLAIMLAVGAAALAGPGQALIWVLAGGCVLGSLAMVRLRAHLRTGARA